MWTSSNCDKNPSKLITMEVWREFELFLHMRNIIFYKKTTKWNSLIREKTPKDGGKKGICEYFKDRNIDP